MCAPLCSRPARSCLVASEAAARAAGPPAEGAHAMAALAVSAAKAGEEVDVMTTGKLIYAVMCEQVIMYDQVSGE